MTAGTKRPWTWTDRVRVTTLAIRLLMPVFVGVALWISVHGGIDDAFRPKRVSARALRTAREQAQPDFDAQVRDMAGGPLHHAFEGGPVRERILPTTSRCTNGVHDLITDEDFDKRCDLVGVMVAVGARDQLLADTRRLAAALAGRWDYRYEDAVTQIERYLCGDRGCHGDVPDRKGDGFPPILPETEYTASGGWTLDVQWADNDDLTALPPGEHLAKREYVLVLTLTHEYFRGY